MGARAAALLVTGLALCAAPVLAQMYKWKDDKGVLHYSDAPPPARQKQVELKDFRSSTPALALPYALAQAVKAHPVILFTGSDCAPCTQAREALRTRGVPFTEKTVATTADRASLTDAGGSDVLPFIVIGRKKLSGYSPADLQAALTAANYPLTSRLPAAYQHPAPQSAAPAVAPVRAPEAAPPRPLPAAPSGIRF